MKSQNFSYRLYSNYTRKNGEAALGMLITIGDKPKQFALNESWPKKLYDNKTGTLRPRHKDDMDYEDLCVKINKYKAELHEIKKKLQQNEGYRLTFPSLMRALKLGRVKGHFPDLMLAMIEERKISTDPKVRIVKATGDHHASTAEKLAEYYKKKKLPIHYVDYQFLCDYSAHLVEVEELQHNTMRNHIKNIKTYLNYSIQHHGFALDLAFRNLQIKELEVPITFLEQFELNRLMYTYDVGDLIGMKRQVLAAFIFVCLTGLRISDLYRASHSWVISKDYMRFMPVKNNVRNPKILTVPLQDIAKKYIQNPRGLFFTLPAEQQFRETLKEICESVDIFKNVKPHSGRHTFGHLYIKWGGLLEALSEIMGHEDLETTRIYVHITKDQKRDGAQKMETALLDMKKMRVAN